MNLRKLKHVFAKKGLKIVKEQSHQFDELNLPQNTTADVKSDYLTLHRSLPEIFPLDEHMLQNLVDHSRYVDYLQGEVRPNNIYTLEYLPFHLVDENWVANYVVNVICTKNPQQRLNRDNVKNYVQHSGHFIARREKFESMLVKAQIKYMMSHDQPNGFMPYYNPKIAKELSDWDLQFREMARRALTFTAMLDRHSVEVGIEEHANLWRHQCMEEEFEKRYGCFQKWIDLDNRRLDRNHQVKFKLNFKNNFKNAWLQNREYEYYQNHKQAIDELGLANKNMKMTTTEIFKVRQKAFNYESRIYEAYSRALKNVRNQERQKTKQNLESHEPLR